MVLVPSWDGNQLKSGWWVFFPGMAISTFLAGKWSFDSVQSNRQVFDQDQFCPGKLLPIYDARDDLLEIIIWTLCGVTIRCSQLPIGERFSQNSHAISGFLVQSLMGNLQDAVKR